MKMLAMDTSSDACSVALQCGGSVHERHEVRPREHTRLLLPMIREVLDDGGIGMAELDAVALGNGPGSFIGVRIAASVAQGICFSRGLKLVPVSSMAAVAAETISAEGASAVAVAQDARMDQVYLGLYRADGEALPEALIEERLQAADGPCIPQDRPDWVAAGAGWRRYPGLLEANRPRLSSVGGVEYPRARFLLGLAARAWRAGRVIDAERLTPFYIRSRVAEPPGDTGA